MQLNLIVLLNLRWKGVSDKMPQKVEVILPTKNTELNVDKDSVYVVDLFDISGNNDYSVTLNFKKPGVSARILALYKLTNTTILNLTTVANHIAPNTSCSTEVRGVLYDSSLSNYIGKILINNSAQQTTSFLDDRVLTLSSTCRNASQPILEIKADEVRASHGAITSNIDPLQLYYLESRGLKRKDAEKLIIKGFFEQTMQDFDKILKSEILKKLKV